MKKINLTGQRFGTWVVLEEAEPRVSKWRTHRRWLCRCDCGYENIVLQHNLLHGGSKNCGCLKRERCKTLYKARWGKTEVKNDA